MTFLGHKRTICSFSFLALMAVHAFGADPDVMYALVDASDPTKGATTTFEVSSVAGFTNAVSTINAWTTARTVTVDGMTDPVPDSGRFTISLQADLSPCTGFSFTTPGTTTTLLGNGHKIFLVNGEGSGRDMYFYVSGGAVLCLGVEGDATASALDITRAASNDTQGPIYVLANSTAHMYDGVVIHDCVGNNNLGGGATVQGGLFHMHGGIIRDCGINGGSVCFGGGVAVFDSGRFIMDGGTISGCFANNSETAQPASAGGGVFVSKLSSFVMNGGLIENCTASTDETAGYGMGGGVAILASEYSSKQHRDQYGYLDSAFSMNGGTIRNNFAYLAGGNVAAIGRHVHIAPITFDAAVAGMNEWKVEINEEGASGSESGGEGGTSGEGGGEGSGGTGPHTPEFAPSPGLFLDHGTIEGGVTHNWGGNVFLWQIRTSSAIPTRMEDVVVRNGDALYGAGVAVYSYWTALTMDGTVISNNVAGQGGGVWLSNNSSGNGTTLKDVTIVDNEADIGGGVYYDRTSRLTLVGANRITGNIRWESETQSAPNNLNCLGHSYPFYISGSLEGSVIGLTDPLLLAGGTDSDVFLSSGYDANNPGVHPYARVFTSDHEGWYADYGDESVTTTTTSMQETTTTADASTFKYNWNLYAYTPDHDMRYRSVLYWDDANRCLTTTSSRNWGVGQIQVNGKSYIAAYKNSSATYTIKTLMEFNPATLDLTAYPKLADLGFALDSTIPSDRTDAYSGTLSAGRPQETYNITMVEEVTTSSSTPDYSAEVRLVRRRDGVELLAVRQRYPWNNLVDIDYAVEGDVAGWTLAFAFTNEVTRAVTTPATFRDPADTTVAATPALAAGTHRITWDANADGFALFATNTTWTLTAIQGGETKSESALAGIALDTRRGVRFVANPTNDILPFAYSVTNWQYGAASAVATTYVYGVPARIAETRRTYHWHNGMADDAVVNTDGQQPSGDGSFDYYTGGNGGIYEAGARALLFSASGEGTNAWNGLCYGLVKIIHSNELGQAVAYFKYADPAFDARQRATGTDEEIVLSDQWLDDFGFNRIDVTPEEVEAVREDLNTIQPNGCRLWENMVLGNMTTNLLVATVPTVRADGLGLALPMTSPVSGYGYDVLYELRRADGGRTVLQRDTDHAALGIPLYPDDRDDARNPSGLYRIWSLIVPNSNHAITNEIPSTNIVGVLKVASGLTNTVTAVPWTALAGDPAVSTNAAIGAILHMANVSDGDRLLAYDDAASKYWMWERDGGTWQKTVNVSSVNGMDVAESAQEADEFRLAPGAAFWVQRGKPRDEGTAAKPYFLYGQAMAGGYSVTISGGTEAKPASTLCANPTKSPVAVADFEFEGIGPKDTIAFNTDGAPARIYVRNADNTAWGYWKKIRQGGAVTSQWATDGEIAPGTGFWYIRRKQEPMVVPWAGWTE